MKTLIVDDHEMFRMGLGALLGQMSLDVEIHEEGTLQGGIDYVKSHADIELILVDFNLPMATACNWCVDSKTRIYIAG